MAFSIPLALGRPMMKTTTTNPMTATITTFPAPKLHRLNHTKPFPSITTFCNRRNRLISFDTADDDSKLGPNEEYCSIKGNRNHFFHGLLGNPLGDLLFLNPFGPFGKEEKNRYYEVKSIKEGMFVRMDLPGIEEDDVKISVMNDIVYVKGEEREKQSEHDTQGRSYEGMVELPPGCYKTNEIDAHLNNGVLRMVIPRKKLRAVDDDEEKEG